MSLPKEISFLRWTAMLSVTSITYLSIAVVIEYFLMTDDYNSNYASAPAARSGAYSTFTVVPLVVFAYTCHPNILPIYDELKK